MAYLARAIKIQKYKLILIYTNYIYITGKFTINSHCYQRWKETSYNKYYCIFLFN